MYRNTAFAIITAIGAFASMLGSANAASFDCMPYVEKRKAPEVVICQTPELSQLDDEMADIYKSIITRVPPKAAAMLRVSQQMWKNSRLDCQFDARCLRQIYERRIEELNVY
jgi:uncharacterized protein